jgi:uncharacterized protein (TIGR02246 family)
MHARSTILAPLAFTLFVTFATALVAGPVSQPVASLESAWSAGFARQDSDALAALYSPDATLFGSVPKLAVGRNEVRDYFAAVPKNAKWTATFGEQHEKPLSKDEIAVSGFIKFTRELDGKLAEFPYRFTFVLIRHDDQWQISVHHTSPVPNATK